jgi:hypothetical protein
MALFGRNKEEETKEGQPIGNFKGKYIGGHSAYPKPRDVKMLTFPDHLEVPELGLTIPYNKLLNVQSMSEKKLKATRLFLVGIFAFAWKKRQDYLVITFKDAIGVEQNPVFDVDSISTIQPFLYQQMLHATTSEPATPQPVPRPAPQGDSMEQLTKLKSMFEAGLITEEEYNTKKTEILSKM